MNKTIDAYLSAGYAEASRLSERCAMFALRAKREGDAALAELLNALSESQKVHANRFLRLLRGKIGPTSDNLKSLFEADVPRLIEQYEGYRQHAEAAALKTPEEVFDHAAKVQKLYRRFLKQFDGDRDTASGAGYHVCQVCGYIVEGDLPHRCPVCNAVQKKFKALPSN